MQVIGFYMQDTNYMYFVTYKAFIGIGYKSKISSISQASEKFIYLLYVRVGMDGLNYK